MRAIALLWGSMVLTALLSFTTQVALARGLTLDEYGAFSSALAAVMLVIPMAALGVGGYWMQLFGKEGWGARRWLHPSLRLVIVSSTGWAAALIGVVWLLPFQADIRTLVMLLSPMVLSQAFIDLVQARLQLEERFEMMTLVQIAPRLARFGVAVGVLALGGAADDVALGFGLLAASVAATAIWSIISMIRTGFGLVGHGPAGEDHGVGPTTSVTLAKGSWPFALSAFFYAIYFQADVLLLGALDSAEAAGIYNAVFVVLLGVYLLPGAIYERVLKPRIHRWAATDPARLARAYRTGNRAMAAIGLGIMVVLVLLAPVVVRTLFGEEFRAAGDLLRWMAVVVPIRFVSTSVGSVLETGGLMRRRVWYQGAVAAFNVVLNVALIPRFSYDGAAVATVLSEVLLLLIYLGAVRRHASGVRVIDAG